MIEYVAGFLFSNDRSRVALIEKSHPAWQLGRLNGIGGKIQPDESPADAMRREFREEAGRDVDSWQGRITLEGPSWRVYFFVAFEPTAVLWSLEGQEDERIFVVQVAGGHLPDHVLPNLRWLIPLCLDGDVTAAWARDGSEEGRGTTRATA